jgi:hypothetical protein
VKIFPLKWTALNRITVFQMFYFSTLVLDISDKKASFELHMRIDFLMIFFSVRHRDHFSLLLVCITFCTVL